MNIQSTPMPESLLPRKERERQLRRDAMLEAARAVFAEKGYARATLDEIAMRSEFGKGTLYNYFEGGKEGILVAILDEIFDEMVALVESAFSQSTTFRESLHQFISSCMDHFETKRDISIILMKETHRMFFSDDHERSQYMHQQHRRVIGALIPHLERARAAGEIRDFEPEAIAHTLLGNINGMQMHLCLETCERNGCEPSLTPSQAAGFLTTLLLDGLVCGQHFSRNPVLS